MVDEQAIKDAFDKAKADVLSLKGEISQIKEVLEDIRNELKTLKKTPSEPEYTAPIEEDSIQGSSGNQGVINNPQSSSIPNTQSSPIFLNMKQELEQAFQNLTDRELSIFMVIYALDKEGREANYQDIAKQLNISDHTIRGYIGSLVGKNIPIKKERYLNGKVSLSIKKEFKQLDLYQKLLKLRSERDGQRTLFDI